MKLRAVDGIKEVPKEKRRHERKAKTRGGGKSKTDKEVRHG